MVGKQMSRSGYNKLKEELEYLITVKRKEIAEELKVARSYGDLSENAEYDEAKNNQAMLEAQISELQNTISNAIVVEDDSVSLDQIGMSSIITIKRVGSDTPPETLQIVSSNESNFKEHKISDESPIGKAALGKKVGDVFMVIAPAGEIEYEVLEISK